MQAGFTDAEVQAAGSGSNLALALRVLAQSRRRDMRIFYAFCRTVDDLADEPGMPVEARREGLAAWSRSLSSGAYQGEPPLAEAVRGVFARYEVPAAWPMEVVRGCEMDLEGARYATWGDLRVYCYRVASAVGLVSARIFGGVGCERYAEELGMALQLTNILRDSAEDYSRGGRVYLPAEDLERFEIREGSWCHSRPRGWEALMDFEFERARGFFQSAEAALPASQRRVMVAAEIMREVYGELLGRMQRDGFRVWEREYRLSKRRKLWLMTSVYVRSLLQQAAGF